MIEKVVPVMLLRSRSATLTASGTSPVPLPGEKEDAAKSAQPTSAGRAMAVETTPMSPRVNSFKQEPEMFHIGSEDGSCADEQSDTDFFPDLLPTSTSKMKFGEDSDALDGLQSAKVSEHDRHDSDAEAGSGLQEAVPQHAPRTAAEENQDESVHHDRSTAREGAEELPSQQTAFCEEGKLDGPEVGCASASSAHLEENDPNFEAVPERPVSAMQKGSAFPADELSRREENPPQDAQDCPASGALHHKKSLCLIRPGSLSWLGS